MMNEHSFRGKPTRPFSPAVDWVALDYLQTKSLKADKVYKLDVLDYALDKALQRPKRSVHGVQLAENLIRDGKRVTAVRVKPSGKAKIAISQFFNALDCIVAAEDLETVQPGFAAVVVQEALASLTTQEQTALYLKVAGFDSEEVIEDVLYVGIRQFRNVLRNAKQKLKTYPQFREACFQLANEALPPSTENGLVNYLKSLISFPKM